MISMIIFIEMMALDKVKAAKSIIYPAPDTALNYTQIHLPDGKIIHRDKRFLIFAGGGISKVGTKAALPNC